MPTEIERLSAIKMALMQTTNSQGWFYMKQIAKNVVDNAKDKILDGKSAAEREEAALKATALRDGFAALFTAIEGAVNFDADDSQEADWFADLSFDTNEVEQ
jgi:hypothetical protein